MKLKYTFTALCAFGVIGLGLVLSGCGDQAAAGATGSGTSSQDAAKNQFLAERGGNGTPGVNSSGTPFAGGRGPGLTGTIEKLDGNKITITSLTDGTSSVVQLADGATIRKQATAQVSDIKTGDTVTARGTKSGDTINAQTVQIGTGGFGGGRGGFGGGFNGTPGTRPNGGSGAFASRTPRPDFTPGTGQGRFSGGGGNFSASGTPGVPADFVSGTVEKVDGSTVTVKAADGSSATFVIGADTRLTKQVSVQITDLQVGNTIIAVGQKNGDLFDATSIQVAEGFGRPTPTP